VEFCPAGTPLKLTTKVHDNIKTSQPSCNKSACEGLPSEKPVQLSPADTLSPLDRYQSAARSARASDTNPSPQPRQLSSSAAQAYVPTNSLSHFVTSHQALCHSPVHQKCSATEEHQQHANLPAASPFTRYTWWNPGQTTTIGVGHDLQQPDTHLAARDNGNMCHDDTIACGHQLSMQNVRKKHAPHQRHDWVLASDQVSKTCSVCSYIYHHWQNQWTGVRAGKAVKHNSYCQKVLTSG